MVSLDILEGGTQNRIAFAEEDDSLSQGGMADFQLESFKKEKTDICKWKVLKKEKTDICKWKV